MTEPIRILHIVGRMDRGGIESFIMNLYRNIDKTKVQFDFLCHYGREAAFNEEIRKMGGRIYEMPAIKNENKIYYHKIISYIRALNNFFDNNNYKIIHGHMTNRALIYMLIAKKNGVKNMIAHSHLSKSKKGVNGFITDILQTPISYIASDHFACSKVAAEWLFSKKINNSGVVKIINNSIDVEEFKYSLEVREKMRVKLKLENSFVIGHVGRFYHEKNHDFLIDIFKEILKEKNNAKMILVGDGPLKPTIHEKVKMLGLENNIIFLGVREDISDLMQAMDVFVLPSHFEGLPVVTVEAQASGLPCVFSSAVTSETNLTQRVKYVSLNNDPKKWAVEIIQIYQQYARLDTSETIREKGYDVKFLAKELEKFYTSRGQ